MFLSAPVVPKPPKMPLDLIERLAKCIEVADSEPAESMADLLSRTQVQNARIADVYNKLNDEEVVLSLDLHFADAIELYARASNLFEYARRERETAAPLNFESVIRVSRICGIEDAEYPEVHERLKTRFDRKE